MSNDKKKNSVIKVAKPSILKAAEQHASTTERAKPGKKALAPEEKASERVTLTLTPQELENFTAKAGGLPLGTYLKNFLKNNTDLLNHERLV